MVLWFLHSHGNCLSNKVFFVSVKAVNNYTEISRKLGLQNQKQNSSICTRFLQPSGTRAPHKMIKWFSYGPRANVRGGAYSVVHLSPQNARLRSPGTKFRCRHVIFCLIIELLNINQKEIFFTPYSNVYMFSSWKGKGHYSVLWVMAFDHRNNRCDLIKSFILVNRSQHGKNRCSYSWKW